MDWDGLAGKKKVERDMIRSFNESVSVSSQNHPLRKVVRIRCVRVNWGAIYVADLECNHVAIISAHKAHNDKPTHMRCYKCYRESEKAK